MCGRFILRKLEDVLRDFPWLSPPDQWEPRYNIAPSQPILAVPNDGKDQLQRFQWGLVPGWAKDPTIGNRMINARAETLGEKPAFRQAFRRRRCLIPADGFYEWQKRGKTKLPMHIHLKSGRPFMFAGLWEVWHAPDGSDLPSCTIITTEPNELIATIHDRMPAIVRPEHHRAWLDPAEKKPDDLAEILRPYPADEMAATEVSRAVNDPRVEGPQCVEPVEGGLWERS